MLCYSLGREFLFHLIIANHSLHQILYGLLQHHSILVFLLPLGEFLPSINFLNFHHLLNYQIVFLRIPSLLWSHSIFCP